MTAYVAILLLCSSPSFTSCETHVNRDSFQSFDACMDDVNGVANYYQQQGAYTVGSCFEVKIGEPV
jgi:hypothetical protein